MTVDPQEKDWPPLSAALMIVIDGDRYLLIRDAPDWRLVHTPLAPLDDPGQSLRRILGEIVGGQAPDVQPYSRIILPPLATGGGGLLRHVFLLNVTISETAAFYLKLGEAMRVMEGDEIASARDIHPLDYAALMQHRSIRITQS